MNDRWKQIAWNGIRFRAPGQWEIGQIGIRHLILEDESGPVMEVKWGPVKGTFSHRAHLKRLAAAQSGGGKRGFAEWFLPPPWEKALGRFKTRGFLWQTEKAVGRGAILFCRACRTATLIQFMGGNTSNREKELLRVLKSFDDHQQDGLTRWSVFDVKATLPETMKLSRYRFEAGRYELGFDDGVQHVHLHRWAPAAAILGGRNLIWFSRTIPDFGAAPSRLSPDDDSESLEWKISPSGTWQRMIRRLKVKSSYFWFRLWHLEDKNRILGVRADSKHPLDFQALNRICAGYESL
jgi:hypothetical protein